MPEKEFNKVFSDNLKNYMTANAMTQTALSKLLGLYFWKASITSPADIGRLKGEIVAACDSIDQFADKPVEKSPI